MVKKDIKKEDLAKVKVEDKIENNTETVIEKAISIEQKPIKSVRKAVDRDMEVAIMNNTHSGFIYIDRKTQNRIEMFGYGDIDYMTVGELLTMKNSQRAIIDNFWIILTEVMSDEVTLDEVLKYLGLDILYKSVLSREEIDNLIIKSTVNNFKKTFEVINKGMAARIVERSIMLFQEDKFNDWSKFDIIQKYVKNDMLFELSSLKNDTNE